MTCCLSVPPSLPRGILLSSFPCSGSHSGSPAIKSKCKGLVSRPGSLEPPSLPSPSWAPLPPSPPPHPLLVCKWVRAEQPLEKQRESSARWGWRVVGSLAVGPLHNTLQTPMPGLPFSAPTSPSSSRKPPCPCLNIHRPAGQDSRLCMASYLPSPHLTHTPALRPFCPAP